jgi:hypothetical protein
VMIGLRDAAAVAGEQACKRDHSEPDGEAGAAFPDPAQPGIPLALHGLMTYPAAAPNTTGRAVDPTPMLEP